MPDDRMDIVHLMDKELHDRGGQFQEHLRVMRSVGEQALLDHGEPKLSGVVCHIQLSRQSVHSKCPLKVFWTLCLESSGHKSARVDVNVAVGWGQVGGCGAKAGAST